MSKTFSRTDLLGALMGLLLLVQADSSSAKSAEEKLKQAEFLARRDGGVHVRSINRVLEQRVMS